MLDGKVLMRSMWVDNGCEVRSESTTVVRISMRMRVEDDGKCVWTRFEWILIDDSTKKKSPVRPARSPEEILELHPLQLWAHRSI